MLVFFFFSVDSFRYIGYLISHKRRNLNLPLFVARLCCCFVSVQKKCSGAGYQAGRSWFSCWEGYPQRAGPTKLNLWDTDFWPEICAVVSCRSVWEKDLLHDTATLRNSQGPLLSLESSSVHRWDWQAHAASRRAAWHSSVSNPNKDTRDPGCDGFCMASVHGKSCWDTTLLWRNPNRFAKMRVSNWTDLKACSK